MKPFQCSFSPEVPALLHNLQITLAISTYQAGKVILISAKSPQQLMQMPRNFPKPMGLAVDGSARLAVATAEQVYIFRNAASMAARYPPKPKVYDALFVPRATYYTGRLDVHDLAWGEAGLWAVNTQFSCLALIDESFNFVPQWKPAFISEVSPGDYCHLNGMAMRNGRPSYVSALGHSNNRQGWRLHKLEGGLLMDVEKNEIVLDGLPMPHSPRWLGGQLYLLLSATGELIRVDLAERSYEKIVDTGGFARGLAYYQDYVFVGLSQVRASSKSFQDLPIAKQAQFAGIAIFHLPTRKLLGHIRYENSVAEIYDVQVMVHMNRPNLLTPFKEEHKMVLQTPEKDFWILPRSEKEAKKTD